MTAIAPGRSQGSVLRQLLAATAIAGALDIGEVIVFHGMRGVNAIRVLQGVAAGWLGRDAFRGGLQTTALGLATHFFIAFCVVLVYHHASRRIAMLTRHPLVAGPLYGLAVFAVMTWLVVPLSRAGSPAGRPLPVIANLVFAHVVCVGIPAALFGRARTSAPRGAGRR